MIRLLSILPEPPFSREALWRFEWAAFLYVGLPCMAVLIGMVIWELTRKDKR